MVSLKHLFQSAKADGTDVTLVKPSNWNAEHKFETVADDVILGRLVGGGPGAVQEIPRSSINVIGVLRVHSSTGWTWGTTSFIPFPFDTADINTSAGTFAAGAWIPPPNSVWRVGVSITGYINSTAGWGQVVMQDHVGLFQAGQEFNVAGFTIGLYGEDIYSFGTEAPNVQWGGVIGGICNITFQGHMIANRLA